MGTNTVHIWVQIQYTYGYKYSKHMGTNTVHIWVQIQYTYGYKYNKYTNKNTMQINILHLVVKRATLPTTTTTTTTVFNALCPSYNVLKLGT